MDKLTYLAELAEGLARWVPERERQDILRYYAEYFEEAGPEREGEVVRELGDPWALSCRLAVDGGFVAKEQAESWTPPKKKKWPWIVAGTVAAVVCLTGWAFSAIVGLGHRVWRSYDVAQAVPVTAGPEVYVEEGTCFAFTEEGTGEVTIYSVPTEAAGGVWGMEDGNLDAFYDIDANISLGNITVTGGEDYSLAIQYSGNLGGYSVKWEIQGDTLKIRDGSSGGHNIGFSGLGNVLGKKAVDVTITVPAGMVLRTVDAKTDLGDIFLADLDVEVKVTGKTDMGNVDGCDIRTAQKVELKTNMGNVTFGLGKDEVYNGLDIGLETDMGDVEVNLECYENECAYKLKTDMGTVSVNGVGQGTNVERNGSFSVKLDAESSMGSVDVYFLDDRW